MSWLNWSLEFHTRLRTISHLVPTHITHVYVQWMSYTFVWLYLIKCVVHTLSYVDQTQKDFWVFLVVFGKCFILKNSKKSKIFTTLFLATQSWVMPVASLLKSSRDSLASESPNREKHLVISGHFHNLVTGGSFSRELTQKVSWLPGEWDF